MAEKKESPSGNPAQAKELKTENRISNEDRKSQIGIECQNCYELIKSSPHVFELHIKSCKIYYKYMERKSDGFQCKLCSYFSAKRFEMNMHLKRIHKTVKISDEEPNQLTNVSKLSNSGEGLLAKKLKGPTSVPVSEQDSSPDSGQASGQNSSPVSSPASGLASSPVSGQASSSVSEQASGPDSNPATGQASSPVSEEASGQDSSPASGQAYSSVSEQDSGQDSSTASSPVSGPASGQASGSPKIENSVQAHSQVSNPASNPAIDQNSTQDSVQTSDRISTELQLPQQHWLPQHLQFPSLPKSVPVAEPHKPKIIPGKGIY